MDIPKEQRQLFPALSVAHILVHGLDPERADYDIDTLARKLIQEGRELHARWTRHERVDAAVQAGSMWMLAQASMSGAMADPGLADSWDTHLAIEQLITDRTRRGEPPTNRSLVMFHGLSTGTAILRSDWSQTRLHGELGTALSEADDVFGWVAQAAFATIALVTGSASDFHRAISAEPGGRDRLALDDLLVMARLLNAIARLDRAEAARLLAIGNPRASWMRWFNFEPMYIWVRAQAALLWSDPEHALAEFDANLAGPGETDGVAGMWSPLLRRTRAELLLNIGSLHRAESILERLLASAERIHALVPAARLNLCTGNAERALALADEGIYSLQIRLPDRAQLAVIKAAAIVLAGGEEVLVQRQVHAACLMCTEVGTAVPFALLPPSLREALIAVHEPHPDQTACGLRDSADRGLFDGLRHHFTSREAPVRLTRRERELLPLLATPDTLQQIATRLFVSVNTVRKQVVTLRQKVGAPTRAELVARAVDLGLLDKHHSH